MNIGVKLLQKIFGTAGERTVRRYKKIVSKINLKEKELQSLSEEEIKNMTFAFKNRLQNGETIDDLLVDAYAVVKNVCRRLCGTEIEVMGHLRTWDMIPYDVQLVGAIAMHKGAIAEMQTGEG